MATAHPDCDAHRLRGPEPQRSAQRRAHRRTASGPVDPGISSSNQLASIDSEAQDAAERTAAITARISRNECRFQTGSLVATVVIVLLAAAAMRGARRPPRSARGRGEHRCPSRLAPSRIRPGARAGICRRVSLPFLVMAPFSSRCDIRRLAVFVYPGGFKAPDAERITVSAAWWCSETGGLQAPGIAPVSHQLAGAFQCVNAETGSAAHDLKISLEALDPAGACVHLTSEQPRDLPDLGTG